MSQHSIVNGPSKYDLMLALVDGDMTHRRHIQFELDRWAVEVKMSSVAGCPSMTPSIIINELERESGDGESWNFKGHSIKNSIGSWSVCGYYSTKTRKGSIEFLGV